MNVIFPPEPGVIDSSLRADGAMLRANRWISSRIGSLIKQIFQCVLVALMAYCSYLLFSKYIVQGVEVDGVSMFPTLHNKDHYLLNHLTYLFRDPKPNDIVVIRDPSDNTYVVKRIVARPGETVYLKGGHVYINGKLLDEPYLQPGTPTYAFFTRRGDEMIVCGSDRYFVLGDNRNNSMDSRIYGTVPRENILGAVIR